MAETAVQTSICDICGAEVREGSLFCYNCGGSVLKSDVGSEAGIEPAGQHVSANGHADEAATYHPAKRRTERAGRRKVRASNRQPVEIVWEPRTATSWPFIVGSVFFIVMSLLIMLAAFYVR